ncbi:hypothetical protein F8M41_014749 [Gigaspora margarita]|uniref:Uncharacterized protein n=1 Tax=Gigaspora margarita TaxID=4874 RepID=A0A8H4ARE5_GIGMA|nr:hypothetical protein F8M41_014749 [Gigaspora margarita]
MIVLITQANNRLTVKLNFITICLPYVTDCNGNVLRDPWWKKCADNTWHWDDAPNSTYCLHAYHRTDPHGNKYCTANHTACFNIRGDIGSWDIFRCDNGTTENDPCNS